MSAGSSRTPLVQKLGIKAGHHLSSIGAPDRWQIENLPEHVTVSFEASDPPADVIIAFFREIATLQRQLPNVAADMVNSAILWLAWPRRAGGHQSDITDNQLRSTALPLGLVDVKVAAIDGDWSGLKMVWRIER